MPIIQNTAELRRVAELPRRDWQRYGEAAAEILTDALKTSSGTQKLKPIQGAALADLANFGGLFAPMKVGNGKTHVSLLAPTLLGSMRPALLIPSKHVEKTAREMQALSWHWKVAKHLRVFSYESLGRVGGIVALDEYQPDLIIADEAHKLKNTKTAVCRRVTRFMRANEDVKFVAMSGTFTRKSIKDYAHLLLWASRQSRMFPLPYGYIEACEWADCLDARNVVDRPEPGALLRLPGGDDVLDPWERAKHVFQRRLVETPGVVASIDTDRVACSLTVDAEIFNPSSPNTDDLISKVRNTFETPEGFALSSAPQVWQHVCQLSLGFYYRYIVRPSDEWFEARRLWAQFVRETIADGKLDSEKQVALAFPDSSKLLAWREQRALFMPENEAVWVDHSLIDYCVTWIKKNKRGIVWVDYLEFGRELSRSSGVPFFHAKARDDNGLYVEDAEGPIIASIHSISDGLNLQYKWSTNLFVSPMKNSGALEQALGRTHRENQPEDTVEATLLCSCIEHVDAVESSIEEARHISAIMGDSFKILYCDLTLPTKIPTTLGRWQRTEK